MRDAKENRDKKWPREILGHFFSTVFFRVTHNGLSERGTTRSLNIHLLYGSVSKGLRTTKFTNLIGWNWYWKQSRFSYLDQHLARLHFAAKNLQTKMKNYWQFSSKDFYLWKCQNTWWEKSIEREQFLAELSLAHRCLQAKCQLVQTRSIKKIKFFLLAI